jgi:hypothetical protein
MQTIIIFGIHFIDFFYIRETSQDYFYYLYKTKPNYDQAFNKARL